MRRQGESANRERREAPSRCCESAVCIRSCLIMFASLSTERQVHLSTDESPRRLDFTPVRPASCVAACCVNRPPSVSQEPRTKSLSAGSRLRHVAETSPSREGPRQAGSARRPRRSQPSERVGADPRVGRLARTRKCLRPLRRGRPVSGRMLFVDANSCRPGRRKRLPWGWWPTSTPARPMGTCRAVAWAFPISGTGGTDSRQRREAL